MSGTNKRIAVRCYMAEKRIIPIKLIIEKSKSLKPIIDTIYARCHENGIETRWTNELTHLYRDYLEDSMTCYAYLAFCEGDVKNGQELEYDLSNLTVEEMNQKYDSIIYMSFHDHRVSLYDCVIR